MAMPGKGDLEQQSMDKMNELTPQRDTRNLLYSMLMGFEGGSVTFINWELVTKKGNTALKDGEKANLFETIAAAIGMEFNLLLLSMKNISIIRRRRMILLEHLLQRILFVCLQQRRR